MKTLCLNGAVRKCALVAAAIAVALFQCSGRAGAQTLTILHSFGDGSVANDGLNPNGNLVEGPDGNFYGATNQGGGIGGEAGFGDGAVFRMTPSGAVTILHSFDGYDGSYPYDGLVLGSDGNFYGTTYHGGSTVSSDPEGIGYGTVFKITPSGTLTVLHSFGDGSVADDGQNPRAGLVLGPDGNYYGTTVNGGKEDRGTVFKISQSGTVTILHSFPDGRVANDGRHPYAGLVLGPDGDFYGTTFNGGATRFIYPYTGGYGTVFKITPSGRLTILHSFVDGSVADDGNRPLAGLVLGSDSNFYGTTSQGGSTGDAGTAFKITPSGTVTILHSFQDGSVAGDGNGPSAGLIQGSDGNFYGTTYEGGSWIWGSVFKMTPSGTITILHSFGLSLDNVGNDGVYPTASLIQGTDGNLYGTTELGGSTATDDDLGQGTVFRLSDGLAPPVPAAPIGLTASAGNGQVTLSWIGSAGATSYNVYRGTSTGGEAATPVASGIIPTAYTDTDLFSGVTYFYKVAAVDPSGTSSTWGEVSAPNAATLSVTPGPTLTLGTTAPQQFTATVYDELGNPMSPQPTFIWSVESGGVGSIGYLDGLYHSGPIAGDATVKVVGGGLVGNVSVTVNPTPVTIVNPASANPSPAPRTKTNLEVLGAYAGNGGESALTYTWAETSGPAAVTYSANGTQAARNTTATFTEAGVYQFTVTIASPVGSSTTSSVTVTVD